MNLNPIDSSFTTYTKKDRLPIMKMLSFQDVREDTLNDKVFMATLTGLTRSEAEEKIKLEVLKRCDERGVNLETVQSKKNTSTCTMNKNASQRMDMKQSQTNSGTLPVAGAESPYVDSCMRHDALTRSSCIKRAYGKIKVIAKIRFQFKTLYVYKLNNVYDYFETDGIIRTNGFGNLSHTDLRDLPIGEEVDITQDSFLIQYPEQYDPATDTVGTGINARTVITTDYDNSGDSAAVSQSFMERLTTLKAKEINIHLNNKSIKSVYPGKFPKLGEIIKSPILFKVCNDIGVVSELAQSARMATGVEDDTIVVDDMSYLCSIEVYCNTPIKDPDLERLRKENLEYRRRVYDVIAPLVDNFYDQCSYDLRILKEHYSHELFNVNGIELKFPFIKMKTITIDVPSIGQKVSKKLDLHTAMCDGNLFNCWESLRA